MINMQSDLEKDYISISDATSGEKVERVDLLGEWKEDQTF